MKIGLYFGSFNPIHVGHTLIANYISEFTQLDEIWFVVTPHNPLKEQKNLLKDYDRLELVRQAIGNYQRFRACDIEFYLPKPSYTIDTLTHLNEKYPEHKFSIIMGGDNITSIHKWKNYKQIINNYDIYVYPRPGIEISEAEKLVNVKIVDAPMVEISASFIRSSIKENKDVRFFVHPDVYTTIIKEKLY